ncbi:MAG: TonB-dependent receptor [Wenzhouxiangellaceae bacterium]|nr:TonB-dependent receptor [Wenzhouxiangellaceae bacterium]
MFNRRVLPTAVAVASAIVASFPAATSAATLSVDDSVVVTATRAERKLDEVPARVSVITRADIERIAPADLVELLRLEAGIDIARSGGPGGQTSVFMRGANSNHVLVLIDGVRAAASGTGAFTWEILDPALIERIEIVRGARAARWGSDAIGGVIQIFTRRPDGVRLEARYGSDVDLRGMVAAGRQGGGLDADLTLVGRSVDGFSAQNANGFAFDPDDDGFDNLSAATGGGLDLAGGRLQWRGRIASGEVEFDQGESEFDNWSWRFDYAAAQVGPWQWRAGLATLRDRLETSTAFGVNEVVTRRLQADVVLERRTATGAWLVGVDGWRESGVSEGQWNESRSNAGVFTGVEGQFGTLGWELAGRFDDDENFGSEWTGNGGLNWTPAQGLRLFATGGKGFRAPNFSQLYSPGFGGLFAGNPQLEPERSWSAELGLDLKPSATQRVTMSAFSNWIDDLVDFSGPLFAAININEARIRGLELSHEWRPDVWRSTVNLTWQDPEDRTTGQDLLRRAEFKGNWTLGVQAGPNWRIDGELVHVGTRDDFGGVELASYTLVNLRAGWQINPSWNAELRIDNLADRDYQPAFGFNAPDRRVFVSLGWQR